MANSLSAFLAENAKKIDNIKYAVSDRFVDENGDAIEWEIKCITAAENAELRKTCMRTVPVRGGRKGQTTQEFDEAAYTAKLAARCTVFPNLNDSELQQSYHVNGADNLIVAMLTPAEFDDYTVKIIEQCGFKTGDELVEEAKLIDEGDPEANYAYYCLHKFRWAPHVFLELSPQEQAFVIAAIDRKVEQERKEAAKIKKK